MAFMLAKRAYSEAGGLLSRDRLLLGNTEKAATPGGHRTASLARLLLAHTGVKDRLARAWRSLEYEELVRARRTH